MSVAFALDELVYLLFALVELENAAKDKENYGCSAEPPCEGNARSEAGCYEKACADDVADNSKCFHNFLFFRVYIKSVFVSSLFL